MNINNQSIELSIETPSLVLENENISLEVEHKNVSLEVETENSTGEIDVQNTQIEIQNDVSRIYEKDHSELKNLDFENSGHTGFQPAGNYIEDENYIHTDNNFTDDDKNKLDGLENFSGSSADVDYSDSDVESTLTNIIDSIGSLDNLETKDTSNLVNAINEVLNNGGGIKELVNADINVMAIEQGIYILSGRGTKLRRGGTTLVTNPVVTDVAKSILFLTRYATGLEEGILIQPSASRLMSVWTFSSTTSRRKDFLNLLTTNNTTAFTPTSYYNPVHKGYVDFGTDLGNIDLSEYNEDVFQFMDTLTSDGKYRFTDSEDGFTWCVEVYTAGDYILGQTYWNTEEGYLQQYHRNGYYDENEDTYAWYDWTSFLDFETANSLFKRKGEVDYTTTSVPDLRAWLDEMGSFGIREYEVIQTSNGHKFMVNIRYVNYKVGTTWNYIRYQEYYDIEEPNKIYRRSGRQTGTTASSPVNWGDWYVFEGTPE